MDGALESVLQPRAPYIRGSGSVRWRPMSYAVRIPLWFLILNMAMMLAAFVLGLWQGDTLRGLPAEEAMILRLAHQQVIQDHVDEHDPGELLHRAIDGMVNDLDRYSAYVPPREVRQFEENTTGSYEGIGVLMAPLTSPITVLFPLSGGPAEREGIQVGDQILAIDGEDMTQFPVSELSAEAQDRLKGEAGQPVTLAIARGEEKFDVVLQRGPVQRPSVKWARLIDEAAGIGYLHLSDFQNHTQEEFDIVVAELEATAPDGLRALVVDLRFNPGGILEECVDLANRFLSGGVIVSLKKRNAETVQVHEADPEVCSLPDLPVVLLVNGESASASEVLAGALQDRQRAVLVGERTYGKGVVQSIYRWRDLDFRLKLTTSHYYTPNGRRIEQGPDGGLEPDRVVEMDAELVHQVREQLGQLEPPKSFREAAHLLATELGRPLQEPMPPEEDTQLAAALEEARRILR